MREKRSRTEPSLDTKIGREEREPRARRPPKDDPKEAKKEEPPKAEMDPRVILAVQCCLESMTMKEITPEFQEKMQAAFSEAIQYEIEVRLPLLADKYESEVGLGCAVVGAGVVRFRVARQEAKATVEGKVVTEKKEEDAA